MQACVHLCAITRIDGSCSSFCFQFLQKTDDMLKQTTESYGVFAETYNHFLETIAMQTQATWTHSLPASIRRYTR